jgi:uncharacterized protein (UPF0332 family)
MVEKAEEFLKAAKLCYDSKLYNSSVNRAYYCMYWLAIAALKAEGVELSEWQHDTLRRLFGKVLVMERGIYARKFGRFLNRTYDLRCVADYSETEITETEALECLSQSREFFQRTTEVINEHDR